MTLYQFKLLDETEQIEAIWEKGVFLASRIDGDYTYKLFRIDNFFVEEQWHTKFGVRRAFISFIAEENLKPYLDAVDISSLMTPRQH